MYRVNLSGYVGHVTTLCLKKTGTPLKLIVSRIQVHKIRRIFYQKIVSQFDVKAEIFKKNRCTVAEICPFKHKHPQTRNYRDEKLPTY